MAEPTLSYILTTYNKLPYLSVTLPLLIQHKRDDEEIVVADGGSDDGTADYLRALWREKKIDRFISERDYGEAHGTNKAFLMARGEIIKIITDDDIFHYPSIAACKTFMQNNPQVDILGFDGFGYNANHKEKDFERVSYIEGFKKWKTDRTPFLFCGLSYMIRKNSLAYMGLFNTNFKIVDVEYSIRVSSLKTNIAFYTGLGFVNIVNPESNSHRFYRSIDDEKKKLLKIYPALKNVLGTRSLELRMREFVSATLLKRKAATASFDYGEITLKSIKQLQEYNEGKTFGFI